MNGTDAHVTNNTKLVITIYLFLWVSFRNAQHKKFFTKYMLSMQDSGHHANHVDLCLA